MSVVEQSKSWSETRLKTLSVGQVLDQNLAAWQAKALANFIETGFPTRKTEDWKYTNVSKIVQQEFALAGSQVNAVKCSANKLRDVYSIVFTNGRLQQTEALAELPKGVIVANISEAMQNETWRKLLQFDSRYESMFSELNAALITSGLFVYVPKDTILEKPIHVSYQTSADQPVMQHPRNLIVLEDHSQSAVFEEFVGEGATYFNNVVTHVVAKPGSTFHHFKLQNEARSAQHIANTVFTQERDSTVTSMVLSLGAELNRENLNFNLSEEGACAHLYGLYLPLANQHIDHHTRVDHAKPQGFSQQVYKGIVGEKGRAVFNGKVMVHQDAQKTAAYQNNKNLLLGNNAEVDTKPELEIYADDVKCSHGATIGELDEKSLFYLRSRGIPEDLARRMLTHAFAEELLTNIAMPNIAKYMHAALDAKLAEN